MPTPIFPIVVIVAEIQVNISCPDKDTTIVPSANVIKYSPIKPLMDESTSLEYLSSPIFVVVIAFG